MVIPAHVHFTCVYWPSLLTIYTKRPFGKNGLLLPMLLVPTQIHPLTTTTTTMATAQQSYP